MNGDLGAFVPKLTGDGDADPAAGAGDENGATRQSEVHNPIQSTGLVLRVTASRRFRLLPGNLASKNGDGHKYGSVVAPLRIDDFP
jgi:hypothetical protein